MASSLAIHRKCRLDAKTLRHRTVGYDYNTNRISVSNKYLRSLGARNGFPSGRGWKVLVEVFFRRYTIDDPANLVCISRDRCINELVRGLQRGERTLPHIADEIALAQRFSNPVTEVRLKRLVTPEMALDCMSAKLALFEQIDRIAACYLDFVVARLSWREFG
jgi:hypothetical protein